MISTVFLFTNRYTILCSFVMRLDQQPENSYFNASGFPIPSKGADSIDVIRAEIRLNIFLSLVFFQNLISSCAVGA